MMQIDIKFVALKKIKLKIIVRFNKIALKKSILAFNIYLNKLVFNIFYII